MYSCKKATQSAGSRSARDGGRRRGSHRLYRDHCWVEPASMDTAIEGVLGLGIDRSLAYQTAESGLNMRTRAAKPVVEVEMAEGGVEVIPPKQADHTAP